MTTNREERLNNFSKIKRQLNDLERIGLWKSANIPDQGTIADTKDEISRILNLVETELERAGLWDRSIDIDKSGSDIEQKNIGNHNVTNQQIENNTRTALEVLRSNKSPYR